MTRTQREEEAVSDHLSAWLDVIARDGWAAARIDAVADAAGTTTAVVAATLPDRFAALGAFGRALDVAALADAGVDRTASVRDRLFAMLMAWFDALQDSRAAVLELARAAARDPVLALFAGARFGPSIARIAAAAGVDTDGLAGAVRVQALVVMVMVVARTWQGDDSADLAATMKVLDERLADAEGWARRMPHRPAASAPPVPVAAPRSAAGLLAAPDR